MHVEEACWLGCLISYQVYNLRCARTQEGGNREAAFNRAQTGNISEAKCGLKWWRPPKRWHVGEQENPLNFWRQLRVKCETCLAMTGSENNAITFFYPCSLKRMEFKQKLIIFWSKTTKIWGEPLSWSGSEVKLNLPKLPTMLSWVKNTRKVDNYISMKSGKNEALKSFFFLTVK